MDIALLVLRVVVGLFFAGHGAQKLWGKFGGHGLEGTGGFFESLGLSPGRRHAQAAGAMTPLASTLISSTMITAIRKVHAKNGPWTTEGGWEYNAVLIAAATLLADRGPGAPSVDSVLFPRLHGKGWAVASLLAAAAGSALVTSPALNEGTAAPADQAPTPADPASGGDDDRFTRDPSEIEVPSGA
ncbi:MAG TPA: DoxX family protein [Microbacterium sp.]|nr:DoxX family protein [Microbacterium sp.]